MSEEMKCPKCGGGRRLCVGGISDGVCGSAWYIPHGQHAPVVSFQAHACRIAELERALATMTADRDSWCEQADQRTRDVIAQAERAHKAEGELSTITAKHAKLKAWVDGLEMLAVNHGPNGTLCHMLWLEPSRACYIGPAKPEEVG